MTNPLGSPIAFFKFSMNHLLFSFVSTSITP
uniref:Uncharacterized protein n=1 Tax=Arundo donax TaxID=35708 RepID=A0A0A9AZY0_ARUDO